MGLVFRVKFFLRGWLLALVLVGLLTIGQQVGAQGFALTVKSSAASLLVSNSLTYTINVTNFNASGDLPNAMVSNFLSSSVQVLNITNSQGTATNDNGVVVFNLGPFIYGPAGAVQLSLTVRPTAAGAFTNEVIVASFFSTNTVTTNVVVLATNLPAPVADLGVAIQSPSQPVIINDLTGYTLLVSNSGPATATGVFLTNSLPPGVILKGSSYSYALSGSNMIFNLGTLSNGGRTNVQISIQPTNAAVLNLLASVGTSAVQDTNTANNTASNSLSVIASLPGTLLAVTNSAQALNVQNGLTEQSILLSNVGTNDVVAARVVVTGLTKKLFNAVGTNNGNPYVCYSAPLAAGQNVRLLLQFSPRGNFPLTNGQLQAYAVPLPDWTPPAVVTTSTNVNISRIVQLANGNMMIEFPSTEGSAYTVVYSDNLQFSNAAIAPPTIVAPANRVQWIDYGPPTTVSPATNSGARFYRVLQNP